MFYELKTTGLEGLSVRVKTNISTLKEVWNILKEVNLDGLLTGGSLELSFRDLVDGLLVKGTLGNFLHAITDDVKADVDTLELSDVVGIITLFFTSIAQPFQDLNISIPQQKTE